MKPSDAPACLTFDVAAELSSHQPEKKQKSRFEVVKSPSLVGQPNLTTELKERQLEDPISSPEQLTLDVVKEKYDVSYIVQSYVIQDIKRLLSPFEMVIKSRIRCSQNPF